MEMVVGTALAAGLSVVVMKNISQQNNEMTKNHQNLAMELAVKQVSDTLKRKSDCDIVIGALPATTLNNLVVNAASETLEGTSVENIENQCVKPMSPQDKYPQCANQGQEQPDKKPNFNGFDGTDSGGISPPTNECPMSEYMAYKNIYKALLDEYRSCLDDQTDPAGSPSEGIVRDRRLRKLNLDFDSDIGGGLALDRVVFNLPSTTPGNVALDINLDFSKRNVERSARSEGRTLTRKIVADVMIKEDGTIDCPGQEREQISSQGLEHACTLVGGQFQESDSTCRFEGTSSNTLDLSDELIIAFKEATCKLVSGGSASDITAANEICSQIRLGRTLAGQNISPNHVQLDVSGVAHRRTIFDSTACGAGQYLDQAEINGRTQGHCKQAEFPDP